MRHLLITVMLLSNIGIFGPTGMAIKNISEIPEELLGHLDKMGTDISQELNDYEGKYLNFIFKISAEDFDLTGKKVGFLHGGHKTSKKDYFEETRSFFKNANTIGGSSLYIFDAAQKEASGGYDAAVIYWSKFVVPIENVVKRLRGKR